MVWHWSQIALWMVNRRCGPVSLSMSSIPLSPSLTRFPCTSAHLTPQEINSGSKGGKRLTHKYKANGLLSSHRWLTEGFDEYQKWCRSWPWFGHLLMTKSWEISITTTWNLAMVLGGWSQSNICIWWPSFRMVPLGRQSRQCYSEWETNLREAKGKGNIQPLFFSLQAGFWPTWNASPAAVVQNRAKHCCVEQEHSHWLSKVCVFGFFVLQSSAGILL